MKRITAIIGLSFLVMLFSVGIASAEVDSCFDGTTAEQFADWGITAIGSSDPCINTSLIEAYNNNDPVVQECELASVCAVNPSGYRTCCDPSSEGWTEALASSDYLVCNTQLQALASACNSGGTESVFVNCGECGDVLGKACAVGFFEICGPTFDESCGRNCNNLCSTSETGTMRGSDGDKGACHTPFEKYDLYLTLILIPIILLGAWFLLRGRKGGANNITSTILALVLGAGLLGGGCAPQPADAPSDPVDIGRSQLAAGDFGSAKATFEKAGDSDGDNILVQYGLLLSETGLLSNYLAGAFDGVADKNNLFNGNALINSGQLWKPVFKSLERIADLADGVCSLDENGIGFDIDGLPLSIPGLLEIDLTGNVNKLDISLLGLLANSLLIWEGLYKSMLEGLPIPDDVARRSLKNLEFLERTVRHYAKVREDKGLVGLLTANGPGLIGSGDIVHLPEITKLFVGGKSLKSFLNTLDGLKLKIPGDFAVSPEALLELIGGLLDAAINGEVISLTDLTAELADMGLMEKKLCRKVDLDFGALFSGSYRPLANYLPFKSGDEIVAVDPSMGGSLMINGKPADNKALFSLINCMGWSVEKFSIKQYIKMMCPKISVVPR